MMKTAIIMPICCSQSNTEHSPPFDHRRNSYEARKVLVSSISAWQCCYQYNVILPAPPDLLCVFHREGQQVTANISNIQSHCCDSCRYYVLVKVDFWRETRSNFHIFLSGFYSMTENHFLSLPFFLSTRQMQQKCFFCARWPPAIH